MGLGPWYNIYVFPYLILWLRFLWWNEWSARHLYLLNPSAPSISHMYFSLLIKKLGLTLTLTVFVHTLWFLSSTQQRFWFSLLTGKLNFLLFFSFSFLCSNSKKLHSFLSKPLHFHYLLCLGVNVEKQEKIE